MKIQSTTFNLSSISLSMSQGKVAGIAATTLVNPLTALDNLDSVQQTLPPIEVEKRGNYTYYRNAFGLQITSVKYSKGHYSYMFSKDGMAVMVRQHDNKRDTLNFSDMNFNIPKTSQIPNVYFHINGSGVSQLGFNERHQPVMILTNGETITFDRTNGQTILDGPFDIQFYPDQTGENFDVIYTGTDELKRYKSKGDSIRW